MKKGGALLPPGGNLIFSTELNAALLKVVLSLKEDALPTLHRIPNIIPAVNMYSSCLPSITFPLKLVEKCLLFEFLVCFFICFTKFNAFILGRFIVRSLCRPLSILLTFIFAFASNAAAAGVPYENKTWSEVQFMQELNERENHLIRR